MSYIIERPVADVPPVVFVRSNQRQDWLDIYHAVLKAEGQWVPVRFETAIEARGFADAARRRTKPEFEAEVRGTLAFVRGRGSK